MLSIKRNDMGIFVNAWDLVIGTRARRDYGIDEGIEL